MVLIDPVTLSQALIRCRSVTPDGAGALDVLEQALKPLGFACHRLHFEEDGTTAIDNLYARIGTEGPNFCFAGHTDVVPPGDMKSWRHDPFAAEIRDSTLYGRGAVDMKSAIAAFVAASAQLLSAARPKGSISLLITGDEEGPAVNGTKKMLGWLEAHNEKIDHCVVGEPTSVAAAGDTLKIGRRGSMNVRVTVRGLQGHAAYPSQAKNPIPALALLITQLAARKLDSGTAHFEPSTLAFTSADVGNRTTNVIPAEAHARFNIRFNDAHTPQGLTRWIEQEADAMAKESGCAISATTEVSGVAFYTAPGPFTELVAESIRRVIGTRPQFSTGGGTSDARFIKDHCPVVELGLAGATMHKTDECVALAEIAALTEIYAALLAAYFGQ